MTYPPRFLRHTNFLSYLQNGGVFDQNFAANLDAELNDIASSIDQEVTRWQAITTASAQLINNASALAMALAGSQRFVATDGQTVYLTTIPWDSSFTAQTIILTRIAAGSTQGGILDWNGLTIANNGGFLQVAITSGPTIAAGDIILIDAFSPGAGVLANLASTAHAKGAALVGIEDLASYFVATTVEGALAEFKLAYNTFVAAVGATSNLMKRDGTTAMTAALPMGGFKVTGAADGVAGTDLVTVAQLNAATQGVLALTQFFLRADVAVSWQSDQAANSHKLAGLIMTDSLGATASEATNKTYVDGQIAAQLAPINSQLTALGNPSAVGKRVFVPGGTFGTAGSGTGYAFTVPSGVTAAIVELWGGGSGGGEGGSGGYACAYLTLKTGDVVTFAVGAGGASPSTSGQATTCFVNGSQVANANGGSTSTGGSASVSISSAVTGGFAITGEPGYIFLGDFSVSYRKGGSAPRGGAGGANNKIANGNIPGGGGGGGNGAAGGALLTY